MTMKPINRHLLRFTTMTLALLALLALVSGCEHTTPVQDPDETGSATAAASLAASAQAPATVDENIELMALFQAPMSLATEESGLYGDIDGDPWTSQGITIPEIGGLNARAVVSINSLTERAPRITRKSGKVLAYPNIEAFSGRSDPAPGDTLFVEYLTDDGLNAVIYVDPPDLLRFVELRNYPLAGPLLPIRTVTEVVFDTNGTLEDSTDDIYHSLHGEEEWANGQLTSGDLLPESGTGPLDPEAIAVAVHRVDNPMFNPLQAWTETEVRLIIGEFDTSDDDVMYSLSNMVHYFNDAEHVGRMDEYQGGPILDGVTVDVTARFIAAPGNLWLETVTDSIRVQIGLLETEEDDLLERIGRVSVFDGTDMNGDNPSSSVNFVPETPVTPGEEPCGGVFEQHVLYPADWWLLQLDRELDIDCDGSGTLTEYLMFQDGSEFTRVITWDGAGSATLTEERPDGTVVSGSWSEISGEFEVTTTFPAGADPVSRVQRGSVIADESFEFEDVIRWEDGHLDSTTFAATEQDDTFHIEGHKYLDEMVEEFTLDGEPGLLVGSYSRNDGATGDFTLEALAGGGSYLIFSADQPRDDGDVHVTGEIWYAPDGSGHGTITVTRNGMTWTWEIEFGPDGTGELTDDQGDKYPL
jgi:hypothetical protein